MNLSEHHVPGSKDTYYIPDFVTADEEAYLLRKVRILAYCRARFMNLVRFRRHLSRNGSNYRIGGTFVHAFL
jgi:hypothetical protein